jgi:phage host-nuclease inhibitor protein Gam
MPRNLRDYNEMEQNGFVKLFEDTKTKTDRLFEGIASKMYRHEYCLVGNDLVEEVLEWFKKAGLNVRIVETSRIQTEIELV